MHDASAQMSAYLEPVAALSRALAAGDAAAFRTALARFDSVRDGVVLTGVRKVTVELKSALQRFQVDSRLIDLQQQVPDARRRLAHVLQLTGEAAHRTMDLIEECRPLAGGRSELLARLEQIALAQSFQDLSGQIIGNVMGLVEELERALGELARISELAPGPGASAAGSRGAHGPVVPGVEHGEAVQCQQDVDALLAGLGF